MDDSLLQALAEQIQIKPGESYANVLKMGDTKAESESVTLLVALTRVLESMLGNKDKGSASISVPVDDGERKLSGDESMEPTSMSVPPGDEDESMDFNQLEPLITHPVGHFIEDDKYHKSIMQYLRLFQEGGIVFAIYQIIKKPK
jgi:hypothetical protein